MQDESNNYDFRLLYLLKRARTIMETHLHERVADLASARAENDRLKEENQRLENRLLSFCRRRKNSKNVSFTVFSDLVGNQAPEVEVHPIQSVANKVAMSISTEQIVQDNQLKNFDNEKARMSNLIMEMARKYNSERLQMFQKASILVSYLRHTLRKIAHYRRVLKKLKKRNSNLSKVLTARRPEFFALVQRYRTLLSLLPSELRLQTISTAGDQSKAILNKKNINQNLKILSHISMNHNNLQRSNLENESTLHTHQPPSMVDTAISSDLYQGERGHCETENFSQKSISIETPSNSQTVDVESLTAESSSSGIRTDDVAKVEQTTKSEVTNDVLYALKNSITSPGKEVGNITECLNKISDAETTKMVDSNFETQHRTCLMDSGVDCTSAGEKSVQTPSIKTDMTQKIETTRATDVGIDVINKVLIDSKVTTSESSTPNGVEAFEHVDAKAVQTGNDSHISVDTEHSTRHISVESTKFIQMSIETSTHLQARTGESTSHQCAQGVVAVSSMIDNQVHTDLDNSEKIINIRDKMRMYAEMRERMARLDATVERFRSMMIGMRAAFEVERNRMHDQHEETKVQLKRSEIKRRSLIEAEKRLSMLTPNYNNSTPLSSYLELNRLGIETSKRCQKSFETIRSIIGEFKQREDKSQNCIIKLVRTGQKMCLILEILQKRVEATVNSNNLSHHTLPSSIEKIKTLEGICNRQRIEMSAMDAELMDAYEFVRIKLKQDQVLTKPHGFRRREIRESLNAELRILERLREKHAQ